MILFLSTPRVVTARGLARALDGAFRRLGHCSKRDFALYHDIAQVDVSRACCARGNSLGDSSALRRVAAVHGYVVHEGMAGHYRRENGPEPEPTEIPEVDEELERLAAEARAEADDLDEPPPPWLADSLADAAHELFLTEMALDDDDTWQRAAVLDWTPEGDHA